MTPSELWTLARTDLSLRLARGTYDAWLADSEGTSLAEGTLNVAVKNGYAVEWLENRLKPVVEKVLSGIPEADGVTVKFFVPTGEAKTPPPPLDEPDQLDENLPPYLVELVEFDPTKRGYIQSSSYAIRFWMPYLGRGPFLLWLLLKSFAYGANAYGAAWPTIPTLADIMCTNRQQITGRTRDGKHYDGWIETLENERIIWYKLRGNRYIYRVMESLPLLTTRQMERLPHNIQEAHRKWLEFSEIEVADWRQLTMTSLIDKQE